VAADKIKIAALMNRAIDNASVESMLANLMASLFFFGVSCQSHV
jgi:hypothetical protein